MSAVPNLSKNVSCLFWEEGSGLGIGQNESTIPLSCRICEIMCYVSTLKELHTVLSKVKTKLSTCTYSTNGCQI